MLNSKGYTTEGCQRQKCVRVHKYEKIQKILFNYTRTTIQTIVLKTIIKKKKLTEAIFRDTGHGNTL